MSNEPEQWPVDKDHIVDLLGNMLERNEELHERVDELNVELAAAKIETLGYVDRLERSSLGIGQVEALTSIALEVLRLRIQDGLKPADLNVVFDLVDRWDQANDGVPRRRLQRGNR